MNQPRILVTKPQPGYELLDSGEGNKLERFGDVVLSRPDPQALWRRNDEAAWSTAGGVFKKQGDKKNGERRTENGEGGWNMKKDVPPKWSIDYAGLKFWIKPTPFKHVGLFPEQATNWEWMKNAIEARRPKPGGRSPASSPPAPASDAIEILNLFGYTGGATLACAQAGANVVHVDGSKAALTWERENAELSGLDKKPIRWILDDARAFVRREIKRGRKYHGIIMDPPAFGHGPDNELWKIEDHFLPLVEECRELLADKPLFFLINGYSSGYSAIAYENNLLALKKKFGGNIEMGELAIEEKGSGRLLPTGIFARWSV